MINYQDLMEAVNVDDQPAAVKILERCSKEELQDIRRDCEVLLSLTGAILRVKYRNANSLGE